MRRIRLAPSLVVLLLASVPLLRGQMSLSLSPVQLEMVLDPGGTGTQSLVIGNGSASPVRVQSALDPWIIGRPGFDVFPAEGAGSLTARDWIRLDNSEFLIPGDERQAVQLTVAVPGTVEPGQYTAAVSFRTLSEAGTGDPAGGLHLQGKLTALIIVTVGKPREDASVADMALEREDGRAVFVLRRKNSGRFFLPTEGEIILRDARGKKTYAADFIADPVPPLSERIFRIPIEDDLAPGRYQAECVLRLLSGKKVTDKRPVVIE